MVLLLDKYIIESNASFLSLVGYSWYVMELPRKVLEVFLATGSKIPTSWTECEEKLLSLNYEFASWRMTIVNAVHDNIAELRSICDDFLHIRPDSEKVESIKLMLSSENQFAYIDSLFILVWLANYYQIDNMSQRARPETSKACDESYLLTVWIDVLKTLVQKPCCILMSREILGVAKVINVNSSRCIILSIFSIPVNAKFSEHHRAIQSRKK